MKFNSGRGGARPGAGAPKKPKEERTIPTSVSIPGGTLGRLDTVADRRGVSRGKVILEAIDEYLSLTNKDTRKYKPTMGTRMTLEIPDDKHMKLKLFAVKRKTTMRAIVLKALDHLIQEYEAEEKAEAKKD